MEGEGRFDWDFTYLANSIDRLLDVSARLPKEKRIRVISISVGWAPSQKGYQQQFWATALKTGETITLRHDGTEIPFATIANPAALVKAVRLKMEAQSAMPTPGTSTQE